MTFRPIEVNSFDLGYTLLSAFVVVFGLLSLFLKERLYIGEAVWATVFGIIIGPYCAGVFNPRDWGAVSDYNSNEITIQVTRIVLAVGVFAIGVELPKAYVGKHWRSLFFLLVPIMVFGWFISSALIFALIPGLDYLSSLAVAACLTPTDPILAAAVVGGRYAEKHVPAHLRHLLAAESGVNDGAAFPMLFISLYLILNRSDTDTAIGKWFYITWAYEIILGTVIGTIIGYVARHVMKFCERHDLIDRHSYVAQYISLALLSNGITTILGSDDLLSSFACGTAFAYDGWFNQKTEETLFSNVIDLIFNCACFIYIGAWIPFSDFNDHSLGGITWWRLFIIGLLVMLLRRLPIMLALYKWIPEVKTFREAVFSGHFGPMGVGAVFISTLAVGSIPEFYPQEAGRPPETQLELLAASMQPIVAFIVLMSIAVHGLSIPFFSLGKRVHSISRTWSRHTSLEPTGTPEWATQVGRITRPEDIVINRDPEVLEKMERGELRQNSSGDILLTPVTSKSGGSASGSGSGFGSRTLSEKKRTEEDVEMDGVTERDNELERQPGGEGHVIGKEREKAQKRRGTKDTQDSVIPDREQAPGDETEWREGNDLIIERKVAAGEEVEVEVIKNCFNEEHQSMSKVVRGAKENIKAHFEKEAKLVKEGMEELGRQISPKSPGSGSAAGKRGSSKSPSRTAAAVAGLEVVKEWTPFQSRAGEMSKRAKEDDVSSSASDSDDGGADDEGVPGAPLELVDSRDSATSPTSPSGPTALASDSSAAPRSGRRQSFRRRLFGRPKTAPEQSTSSRPHPDPVEESDADDDAVVRPRLHDRTTSAETERPRHRSRSESPRPLHDSPRAAGQRRQARFQLPAPESRDEVDDPASLSQPPSANALQARLRYLAATSASDRDEPSPTSPSTGTPSRQGSGGTPPSNHSRVQSLQGTTRSIRFAEQTSPFAEKSASSNSLSRLANSSSHQHLHYTHSSGRHASPGPGGSSTPQRRLPNIGSRNGLMTPTNRGTQSETERDDGDAKGKIPLSEMF